MDPVAAAKEISNEAAQLAESLEQDGTGGTPGTVIPTNYSSSTNSCTVDPETGVITLVTELFPGETPISPAPAAPAVPAAPEQQDVPPGQVPAQ